MNVKTIFYPGLKCSQTQAAKYTQDGFETSTGEWAKCKSPIDAIINLHPGPEIDEVHPYHPEESWTTYIKKLPFYTLTTISNWITQVEIDAKTTKQTLKKYHIDFFKVNFGQHGDMANHQKKYDHVLENHPETHLILWGVSRGAATTFNSVAHNKYDTSRIKLTILEGCFDHMENILDSYHPIHKYTLKQVMNWTCYQPEGPSPLTSVEKFPHHIPVAFITSNADDVVPAERTEHLAKELAKTGHPNVHLLILEEAPHHNYPIGDTPDQHTYQIFIHALYKHYDLPHKEEYLEGINITELVNNTKVSF